MAAIPRGPCRDRSEKLPLAGRTVWVPPLLTLLTTQVEGARKEASGRDDAARSRPAGRRIGRSSGLICAYRFAPDQPGVPITGDQAAASVSGASADGSFVVAAFQPVERRVRTLAAATSPGAAFVLRDTARIPRRRASRSRTTTCWRS